MLIVQSDIKTYCDHSLNIKDEKIDPHIRYAEKEVFRPQVDDDFYTALKGLEIDTDFVPTTWITSTIYNIDDYVEDEIEERRIYKALTSNGATRPHTSATDWELQELASLWYEFIKRWLANEAAHRYMTFGGRNASDYGFVIHQEDNHRQINDRERAELAGQYRRSADAAKEAFYKRLCDDSYTYDGTKYTFSNTSRTRATGGILAF